MDKKIEVAPVASPLPTCNAQLLSAVEAMREACAKAIWQRPSADEAARLVRKIDAAAIIAGLPAVAPQVVANERAMLARQIVQDANDTLRDQAVAMKQLNEENLELRAALAAAPVQAAIYPEVPEGWKRTEDGRLTPPAGSVGIAYVATGAPDTDPNAAWLSLAHIICADAGIPVGHISDRLEALRDKLDAPAQAQEPVSDVSLINSFMLPADHAHLALVAAARSTPVQPVAVPDGWKLVPLEPSAAMQAAGAQAVRIDTTSINKIWTGNAVFRAMIAAAPAAPAAKGDPVTDAGLPELREHLKIASVYGSTVTLSSASATALYHAMTTGEPMSEAQGDAIDRAAIAANKAGTSGQLDGAAA